MPSSRNGRRIYWWIAFFAIGAISWLCIRFGLRNQFGELGHKAEVGQLEAEVDISIPGPELEPEDVVRLQVNSIRDALNDIEKLKVCYSLASPENRSLTGPFSRFSQIVMTPPYDLLATSDDWQLGSTFVEGELAAVLVSTISKQGEIAGFRFVLRRQDFPRSNCWLTEGVSFLPSVNDLIPAFPDVGVEQKIE